MTPSELETIGKTLYGRDWKSPLANALGLNEKTIGRNDRGESPITEDDVRAVTALVMTRKWEHDALAKTLRA